MLKLAALPVTAALVVLSAATSAHANHQEAIQVESWYQRYLGRCADAPSMQAYVGQLCRGRPGFEIEAELLGSEEYYHRNGCDVHLFIRALFRDVLGRGTNSDELEDWCRRLRRMDSRAELARRFIIETRGRAPVPVVANYAPVVAPQTVYVAPQPTVVVRQPVYVSPPVTFVQPAPVFVPHHHHHRPAYYGPAVRSGLSVNVRVPF